MDATPIKTVSETSSSKASDRVGLSTDKANTIQPPTGPPLQDTVELSSAGTALSRLDVQPRMRIAPTSEIRAQISEIHAEIKARAFLTPERMEGTVEKLLDILG